MIPLPRLEVDASASRTGPRLPVLRRAAHWLRIERTAVLNETAASSDIAPAD